MIELVFVNRSGKDKEMYTIINSSLKGILLGIGIGITIILLSLVMLAFTGILWMVFEFGGSGPAFLVVMFIGLLVCIYMLARDVLRHLPDRRLVFHAHIVGLATFCLVLLCLLWPSPDSIQLDYGMVWGPEHPLTFGMALFIPFCAECLLYLVALMLVTVKPFPMAKE